MAKAERFAGPMSAEEARAYIANVHLVGFTFCPPCALVVAQVNDLTSGACPYCGGELSAPLKVLQPVGLA